VFIEAKDDGGGGDNWTTGAKSCKAPVKSPPTNQHPVILQAGCHSCRPTNSVKALKGIYLIADPQKTEATKIGTFVFWKILSR